MFCVAWRAENLKEFVGAVGVWGDMNEILIDNMNSYKGFVEQVDPEELAAARAKDRETLKEGNRQFWEKYRVRLPLRSELPMQGTGLLFDYTLFARVRYFHGLSEL